MGGNFPALGNASSGNPPRKGGGGGGGAWGTAKATPSPSYTTSPPTSASLINKVSSEPNSSTAGAARSECSSGSEQPQQVGSVASTGSDGANPGGNKKNRKTKIVLMSNAR
jgi:hypothetical protein